MIKMYCTGKTVKYTCIQSLETFKFYIYTDEQSLSFDEYEKKIQMFLKTFTMKMYYTGKTVRLQSYLQKAKKLNDQ